MANLTKLKDLLTVVERREEVQQDKTYRILGVRWYTNGVFVKAEKKGSEIQAKYVYRVEKGDFIYNRLFAWKGSYALVPEEFSGCYASNEFPCFTVNEEMLAPKYLLWFFSQSNIWDISLEHSSGSTAISRNRLKIDKLLELEIPLPNLDEQNRIVQKIDFIHNETSRLSRLQFEKKDICNQLRQSVLQDAIQGKLVEQNPDDEPACVFLEKIREEKERLIKEKKIKKEKPLPPITEDEVPFDLPKGWEWVRLGSIGQIIGGGTPKTNVLEFFADEGIPWVTPADLCGLKGKYISKGRRDITEIGLAKSSATLMPRGSVLFSSRAPIGYVAISKNPISTNQGFKSCVPILLEMNEFIYYFLKHAAKEIDANASGTTFKEVSGKDVSNLLLPLPSLEEQKRIVKKIDQLMAYCDELEENIEQCKQQSELLMDAVLQEAFNQ